MYGDDFLLSPTQSLLHSKISVIRDGITQLSCLKVSEMTEFIFSIMIPIR